MTYQPRTILQVAGDRNLPPRRLPRQLSAARAAYWAQQQRQWIERCGGHLAGYVANYGAASDPNHSGDGAEAIYAADLANLRRLEALVRFYPKD